MTNCAGSSTSYWICGMSSSTEPCVCRVKEQWQHMWIHWYWIGGGKRKYCRILKACLQIPSAIDHSPIYLFFLYCSHTEKKNKIKKSVKTINEPNINVKYERLFVKYIDPYCCLSISITKDINPSWIHTNTHKEPIRFNCSLNVSYCHITVQQYWDQGCSNVIDGQRWDSLTLPLVFTLGNNIPASYQMSTRTIIKNNSTNVNKNCPRLCSSTKAKNYCQTMNDLSPGKISGWLVFQFSLKQQKTTRVF